MSNNTTGPETKPLALTKEQRAILDSYYDSVPVDRNDMPAKIAVLRNKNGTSSFHAWGGHEDDLMELNTLEYIFLSKLGQFPKK